MLKDNGGFPTGELTLFLDSSSRESGISSGFLSRIILEFIISRILLFTLILQLNFPVFYNYYLILFVFFIVFNYRKVTGIYSTIGSQSKISRGNPYLVKILISFPCKVVVHNFIIFSAENAQICL